MIPDRPSPATDWALFLDLDGTLLEIANSPSEVVVPPDLVPVLGHVAARLGGALALVSGRSIREIDALLGTNRFAAAGLHGLEWRDATGTVHAAEGVDLRAARDAFGVFAESVPGAIVEDKGLTVALHYRLAPGAREDAVRLAHEVATRMGERFSVQEGKMVVEIKPAGATKGTAVTRFMSVAPFASRCPVYVGDDLTDEDAFDAVNRLGGHSVRVGPSEAASHAQHRLAGVNDVYVWLQQIVAALPGTRGHSAG